MTSNALMPADLDNFVQAPIRLSPNNFTYNMWGGDWIPHFKSLPPVVRPVGESWEFSTHPDHPNRVHLPDGQDVSLIDLITGFPAQIFGGKHYSPLTAPFLLKFIDSRDDLSLQVHPSNQEAQKLERDSGKSEAWYILESSSNPNEGFIYLGFNPDKAAGYSTLEDFEEAFLNAIIQANSQGPVINAAAREKSVRVVLPFLNKIKVKAGEAYRVAPGTIHAIGRGVRLFEIQETSDITYRIWDWNRPDTEKLKDNKLEFRPLHLEKAKQVLNYASYLPAHFRIAREGIVDVSQGSSEELSVIREDDNRFSCHLVSLRAIGAECVLKTNNRFCVLTGIKGSLALSYSCEKQGPLREWGELGRGRSVLIPAAVHAIRLRSQSAEAEILKSFCPA